MKVQITHTVDLEQIPEEVERILRQVDVFLQDLQFVAETVAPRVDPPFETIKSLDRLRRLLYEADLKLQDCQSIMIDYQSTLAASCEVPPPPPTQEEGFSDGSG